MRQSLKQTKHLSIALIILFAGSIATIESLAQNRPPRSDQQRAPGRDQQRGGGGGGGQRDPLFQALDTNGDGELSTLEMNNAPTTLGKLDRNRDGQIETSEYQPAQGRDSHPTYTSRQQLIAMGQTVSPGLTPQQMTQAFSAFNDKVNVRWDDDFYYIESDAFPDHRMMVNITGWNQQVPLPQPYTGDNAIKIPRHPVENEKFAATTLIGPIAVAINGVPIFDPMTQGGVHDAFINGELDEFGGHAGRADDYHYHIAPFHLANDDKAAPIAFGLDGYPILGKVESNGQPATDLDKNHGHYDADESYHYHGSDAYPYFMSGFKGSVNLTEQQPRAGGIRPYTAPLRGASIVDFIRDPDKTFRLVYEYRNQQNTIRYQLHDDRSATFDFIDPTGQTQSETYTPRNRNRGGGGGQREPGGNAPQRQQRGPQDQRDLSEQNSGGSGVRMPWLLVHAKELDPSGDGILTRQEMIDGVAEVFALYDNNADQRITDAETRAARVRHPMGGFIKMHYDELDTNRDGDISLDELNNQTARFFDKSDRNRDQQITPDEYGNAPNALNQRRDR